MAGHFGTALVGLGQDCAKDYAGKVLPTPAGHWCQELGWGEDLQELDISSTVFLCSSLQGCRISQLLAKQLNELCLFWGAHSFLSPPCRHSWFTTAQRGCARLVIAPANLCIPSLSLGTSSWSLFHLH